MASLQLRKENILLRAQHNHLKEEVVKAYTDANEALSEVINTSKSRAVKTFEMLAKPMDIPRFKCRLDFQKSLHWAMAAAEEPPIFQDSLH